MRTESSVGSESASSRELVCRDCVPPSTAASAWTVTRTTLLSGCWAVSDDPAVWVWNRSIQERGSFARNRSLMILAHRRLAARNFFQAEDSIRDDLVTGVQTCALPIFHRTGHSCDGPAFGAGLKTHVGPALW